MRLESKTLITVMAVAFVLVTTPACTKQNRDSDKPIGVAQNNGGGANVAYAAETTQNISPRIMKINKVTPKEKGKAQDFTWEENGKTVSFLEYTKNKVVFLNFWATWCGPCRMEIPDIVKIDKDYSGKKFVVIGVTLERDMANAMTNVKNFAQSKGIQYLNFIAPQELQQSLANAYGGISGVPTTYIIDNTGSVNEVIVGARPYHSFKQSIDRVLK